MTILFTAKIVFPSILLGKSEQTLLAPSCLDIITTPFTGSTLFGIIRGPNCSFQLSLATSTKPTAEGLSKTVMVRFIMLFGLWSF